jgi:hypothetical protein
MEIKSINNREFRAKLNSLKNVPYAVTSHSKILGFYIPIDYLIEDYPSMLKTIGNNAMLFELKKHFPLLKVKFTDCFQRSIAEKILKELEAKYGNTLPKEELIKALE